MSWTRMVRTAAAVVAVGAVCVVPRAFAADANAAVKAEMLTWIGDAENKLVELAEATPQEKYTWRPSEGVRSQGEVFMHVAGANYGIPSFWGVAPPEGFKFDGYEQSMTKKADIIANLKASFAHMKKSLESADDATLAKEITMFGTLKSSVRGGYMLLLSHAHEHLGQSIAYARSNGIVPPWTARQNAQIEEAKAKKAEMEKKDEHAGHDH